MCVWKVPPCQLAWRVIVEMGSLTLLIEKQLVEAQATRLLADEAVHVLRAMVVHSNGILQRLHA